MNINKENLINLTNRISKEVPEIMQFAPKIIKSIETSTKINEYLENNTDNRKMMYISKNQTLTITKEFLSYLNPDYIAKFNNIDKMLLTRDEVEYELNNLKSIKNALRLSNLKEEGSSLLCLKKEEELKIYLDVMFHNNISDSIKIVHEFMHLVSSNYNEPSILEEVLPIYSELVMTNYLVTKGLDIEEEKKLLVRKI